MLYGHDPISIQDFASIIKLTTNTPSHALTETMWFLVARIETLKNIFSLEGDAQESSKIMHT